MQARIVNEEAALIALAGRLDEAGRDRLQAILRAEAEAYDGGRIEEANPGDTSWPVALAMVPVVAEGIFDQLPEAVGRFFHSGDLVGTFSAALLNLLVNGIPPREQDDHEPAGAIPLHDPA